jgi:hypothetical protein
MKKLKLILQDICKELNLPFGYDEAILKGSEMHLELEHSSHYGGYRFINVGIKNGGHYGAFGESSACERKSLKVMTNYLEGIYNGIKATKKQTI